MQITLQAARVNAGLTQKSAASELGISPATLRSWESHPERVPQGWRRVISIVYSMPIENIFFQTD